MSDSLKAIKCNISVLNHCFISYTLLFLIRLLLLPSICVTFGATNKSGIYLAKSLETVHEALFISTT